MPTDQGHREAESRQSLYLTVQSRSNCQCLQKEFIKGAAEEQIDCLPEQRYTSEMEKGSGVFVTVGTTKFDALVEAVDSIEVAEALIARGYRTLTIQVLPTSYAWIVTEMTDLFLVANRLARKII